MTCAPVRIYGGGVSADEVTQWCRAAGFKPIGFRTPKANDYYMYALDTREHKAFIDRTGADKRRGLWSARLILEDIL